MRTPARYLFVLLILLTAACQKKKYPVPENSSEATFYSTLIVNGQPLSIKNGENGYYMYSSYNRDLLNVYTLVGELKQEGCATNCPNSIRFEIIDAAVTAPGDAIAIDKALQVKNYDFWNGDTSAASGYLVNLTGLSNRQNSSFHWQFDDGATSTQQDPVHVFAQGTHQITFTTTSPDMSQSSVTNIISSNSANDLNVYVSTQELDTALLSFTPHVTGGTAPYRFSWDFGDRTSDTARQPRHHYLHKGGYATTLNVRDAQGKTATWHYNAVAGSDQSAFAANFSFSDLIHYGKLSNVIIRYTDQAGITYTSYTSGQPSGSGFQILSVEDFVNNENNQPVKKVKLKFNCTLYNGAQAVSLQGTEVTVGFAYKQ